MATAAKKTWHLHACTTCRRTYGDTCETATSNATCNECRSGLVSAYGKGRNPIACCLSGARLATKDEIKTYRLAGPGPWWICRTCSRQHGYDPATKGDLPK